MKNNTTEIIKNLKREMAMLNKKIIKEPDNQDYHDELSYLKLILEYWKNEAGEK